MIDGRPRRWSALRHQMAYRLARPTGGFPSRRQGSLSLWNAANKFAETLTTFAAPKPLLFLVKVPAQRFTNECAPRASNTPTVAVDFGEKRCIHTQRDADHAAHVTTVAQQRSGTVTISAQFVAT